MSLNEKDRRLYAGIEALKLGHGGQNYIARILGCSRRTVRKGATEVSGLSSESVMEHIGESPAKLSRIRQPGSGRKPYWVAHPDLNAQFLKVLHDHTAGDPMDETVRWTNLKEREIVSLLQQNCGVRVSRRVVRQLLKKNNYRRRKARKRQPLREEIPNRDAQFRNIAELKAKYQAAGNPIVSMDTKKKNILATFIGMVIFTPWRNWKCMITISRLCKRCHHSALSV